MNKIISNCKAFFCRPFFSDRRTLLGLWMIIAITGMTRFGHGRENNYLIFKYEFWHVIDKLPLYIHYPDEYFDLNHYGPFFALVIAPFALLPTWLGMLLWLIALTLFLYIAVTRDSFSSWQQVFICWFCAHELLNGIQMQQFNIAIAAIVVLSYHLIRREKDFWAACLIVPYHDWYVREALWYRGGGVLPVLAPQGAPRAESALLGHRVLPGADAHLQS